MDNEIRFPELSSADSEARFRRIFISHLISEGYSEEEAFQFIFKTPPCYHGPPSSENGLDLVSTLHEETKAGRIPPASRAWFEKLRGVLGLGGVYYGAKMAEDVLDGEAGSTSKMVERLQLTAEALEQVPEGTSLRERGKIFSRNLATWSHMVTGISEAEKGEVSEGLKFLKTDMHKVFAKERKFRLLKRKYSAPSPSGIFELVNKFILKTFKIKGTVSNYNKNIDGFKLLVKNLVEGLQSITPQARDQWWLTHELPEDLLVFSLTGSMPDSYLNDFKSPLWTFKGYHPMSSDFNAALRSSYYDVTACENTQINDSQVSHFASRFWGQMYPSHRYKHYYLGVLGTHHWGMGFPYAIEDGDKNPFPRTVLLKSISSFISTLDNLSQGSEE